MGEAAPDDQRTSGEGRVGPGRGGRWARPPAWLWPLSIAMQVGAALWLTGFTYFFQDDLLFLEQARTQRFDLTYLREGLFEHFSPVSRVLDKILSLTTPPSIELARAIEMLFYAGTIAAFAWVVVIILGRRWSALALTLFFGQSLFLMRLLMWWTATANILPSTFFGLLAIGFYLRWRGSGGAWRLIGSFIAFGLALLDYENAMLIPVYLVLIRLVVLNDKLTPSSWVRNLWRERWAWLGYAILDAAALANYLRSYYYPIARPPLDQLARFLELGLFEGFVPAVFGLKDPELGFAAQLPVVVTVDVVAVAIVAFAVWLRPRTWRCIAVFLGIYLLSMVPLGLERISLFGIGIGQELYYQQSLQASFWILVALTLSLPRRERRRERALGTMPRPRWIGARALAVVALAVAFAVGYVSSVNALEQATPGPVDSGVYIDGILAAARAVRTETGHDLDLLDLTAPPGVIATAFFPYNRYDMLLGLIDPQVHIDQGGQEIFSVTALGELVRESLRPMATGNLSAATVSASDGYGAQPAESVGGTQMCAPGGSGSSRISIPLSQPIELPAAQAPLYGASVSYVEPSASSVDVFLNGTAGLSLDTAVPHDWVAGAGADLFPLLDPSVHQLAGLVFSVPDGSCITAVSVGEFVATR